jgi:hypothetical protein
MMQIHRFARTRLWWAVFVVALTSASCESKTKVNGTLATFTLSGAVRSGADLSPVEAALVQASGLGADGKWTLRDAVTDAAGHFVLTGLRDSVTVTSAKSGFHNASAILQLTQDTSVDLTMGKVGLTGGDLVVNQTVFGAITPSDERCDLQWDHQAPCRRFDFVPPAARVYQFVVNFQAPCELELHVFDSNGSRLFNISAPTHITKDFSLGLGRHEVRLMAYYTCDRFDITVK